MCCDSESSLQGIEDGLKLELNFQTKPKNMLVPMEDRFGIIAVQIVGRPLELKH